MGCDLIIDGLCSEDSGSGTGLVATTRIVAGSQTITAIGVTDDDGNRVTDDDGNTITDTASAILAESSGNLDAEDGTKILTESSATVVVGSATPLMYVSTSCQYVVLAARSTNVTTVWVSGPDVEVGLGIPLLVGEDNVHLPIDDVSKVYIIGNVGDGVTFVYGTTTAAAVADENVTDDDGNLISDDDGNPVS